MGHHYSGINALKPHDVVASQIRLQRGSRAKIRGSLVRSANDKPFCENLRRLDVLFIASYVPDVWVGETHYLPSITRVSEDLLIAVH
jgi:hypothetical protein